MKIDRTSLRWGVIGCGQIALDKSLPALLAVPDARLAAIADPLPERRALARTVIGANAIGASLVREYADYRDLLADPNVDAVYVALPTGMHAPAVIAAASAKKAILCEKPLGRSADETRTMIRAAREHDVALMTGYMSRFGDVFSAAATLLREGAIGQITLVFANFSYPALGPYPPGAPGGWRWTDPEGGGPLLDIGVYLAFGLRELMGARIVRVGALSASTIAPENVPNHDTTVAWFETENGVPGLFASTFAHAESRVIFYGADGHLELSRCFSQKPTGRLVCHGRVETEIDSDPGLTHFENYRREFEHFTRALLQGTAFAPTPDDALADALLLDALKAGGVHTIPSADDFLHDNRASNETPGQESRTTR